VFFAQDNSIAQDFSDDLIFMEGDPCLHREAIDNQILEEHNIERMI
jgi:hypothetical protein